ncbi:MULTISPECIES: NAD(P)-binding domain-containing protein [Streptomyces]|uniref:NAD(P)-binding domain-containing protein n=1 Tax=Streptomyces TaxID=1883 RepID=UPI00211B576C|nr:MULTISPECIES: NAD(P)-binding domain-containing protein [Streptomyces]MDX3583127.1 NAD(P)-binding domain-containing protein [Streptomyces europaeiscabiei]MDX3613836.1 NAD(P)-binding domain-containing protein [Streptomyces europaeiscabiei]MDX3633975.1 NAD(P)-binding domain-containing protein [Streptomyces europaeiscabiei]MDX3651438.1 NAD(P)-binding domain-containing protein [Streptomyces europaeiscabiei]WUD35348.1 NAD(P)-binding domain-containing protein [Streptomyces europaeiscabiei]
MTTLTVLHPGAMGAAVAAEASRSGHQVLWVPADRSAATRERAGKAGLTASPSLAEALDSSEVVLSLCSPRAAEDVAVSVAGHGFTGLYVEANAVSPHRMERIAYEVRPASSILDGAAIGPPPGDQRTCVSIWRGTGSRWICSAPSSGAPASGWKRQGTRSVRHRC